MVAGVRTEKPRNEGDRGAAGTASVVVFVGLASWHTIVLSRRHRHVVVTRCCRRWFRAVGDTESEGHQWRPSVTAEREHVAIATQNTAREVNVTVKL